MKVIIDSDTILQATVPGRYRHIELGERAIRLVLPPSPGRRRSEALAGVPASAARARRRGAPRRPGADARIDREEGTGSYFRLPPTTEPQPFELQLS